MKALILAAGLGTRLLPYTKSVPKPLFTLNQRPMLELTIEKLIHCGCDRIFINTHHCHKQINAFIEQHRFKKMIQTIYEPQILDTGGAIANIQQFMDKDPFFVINADIIFDIDLKQIYESHLASRALATLVVHNYPQFNKIRVDGNGFIENFNAPPGEGLAFTGIQVLSPGIYSHMPEEPKESNQPEQKKFSSIDVYKALAPAKKIKAHRAESIFWKDIGTIPSYAKTSRQCLSAHVLGLPENKIHEIQIDPIPGDGSDRLWFRACHGKNTMVICDHGICLPPNENWEQLQAFVNIGNHLSTKKIAVPKILGHDELSGQVALEDLGDIHLTSMVTQNPRPATLIDLYKKVIDRLIEFSQTGIQNFDTRWTCQTKSYSKEVILEKECAYFMTAFIQNYLGKDLLFDTYAHEFNTIAENALKYGFTGLMHRDFQSKNIMIRDETIYFIDFQSARIGPLQYDLASLLIDPYVKLPKTVQKKLLSYTMSRLEINSKAEKNKFEESYKFCCLTRNLQFLGAFAFLSRVKGKKSFESHIPAGILSLKSIIRDMTSLPTLSKLIKTL
ncbi:MAG: phosphotransferase [Desulfobacteraceae bacterium]|nr:phosphotransferase [Desulfobacteraceae bacterium]